MANKEKYYVVWVGVTPGIYTSWTDCQLQINGYKGACYKSFGSRSEAEEAYRSNPADYVSTPVHTRVERVVGSDAPFPEEVVENALAVDAACSGNPGQMEYRGVYVGNGQQVFHFGPVYGTNNIGEFLAIVHGLALLKQKKLDLPLYSDSRNAILWVKQKRCKTTLPRNAKSEALFQLIDRAERWLNSNSYTTRILKWETNRWGEIPADFGRK